MKNIYEQDDLEDMEEDDELNSFEAAFMIGYNQSN